MLKKLVSAFLLALILTFAFPVFLTSTRGETFLEWQVGPDGGQLSESNGVITLSGDDRAAGPSASKEFKPQEDFEITFQLKAETLGEVHRDPAGAGEGFGFSLLTNNTAPSHGVGIEMRARAGGQFLMVWHDDLCDQYGWGCNWEPFVYNSLGYNDGSTFWHSNPPQDRSNAPIQPDVWYTLKLKVQETPFSVTGEVHTENGTLLGAMTIDSMNDITFREIRYVGMHSGFGGTFYVRNVTGITSLNSLPDEPATSTPQPTPTNTPPQTPGSTPVPSSLPIQSPNPTSNFSSVSPEPTPAPIFLKQDSETPEKTTLPIATVASVAIAATAIVFVSLTLRRLYRDR